MKPSSLLAPAGLLLLTQLFVGCAAMKRPVSELAIPASWQAKNAVAGTCDPAALSSWWRRFHDSVLDRLIAEALTASPDVRAAWAKIEESRARRGVARSALFPAITGTSSGQATRRDDRRAGLVVNRESYTDSLDLSWEVDLFGKLRQDAKAAAAELEQAAENHHGTQVLLAAEVADAYVSLRTAELQWAVYRRNVEAREGTVQITRWREQAGEGSTFETQQAASTLEQARAVIPSLKQTIEQTRNRLALLCGRTPGSLEGLLSEARSIPEPPATLATGIPAETLRQRPDVRAAERALEAAVARTRSAGRERLPSLALGGTLGLEALTAGSFFSPEIATLGVAGQLAAPILNAGAIRQNIKVRSAQEKQALIAWEAAVLNALSEVENALIAVQRTSERLRALDVAVAAALEADELARQNYQAGQIDLLQVLDAERTLLTLEEQQAIARGNRASAHIQLYRALGGGWSP